MLEFGIGLGMAGMGMPELPLDSQGGSWDSSCHPQCSWRGGEGSSCSRQVWEHSRAAAAAHLQAAKLGEKSCKKSFSARGSGSLPSSWPRSVWGFPAEGLDAAP